MNAKELMIGDWVQNTNGNKGKFSAMIYQGYRGDCDFVIRYAENSTCYSESKLICPIPLTSEILEKNPKVYYLCSLHLSTEESSVNGYVLKVGANCIMGINYIHELQHALRLCGLNEMADNIQI